MIKKASTSKRGFTLAETLITLTIIGVVMALMLRAINRVNPDKDKIQFIKTYHALEMVIADVINDPQNYDQAMYTDSELAEMDANDIHVDFRYAPYASAKVVYVDSSGAQQTKSSLSQSDAVCYFAADRINTIGGVSCDSNPETGNMKLSTGVCLYNMSGVSNTGQLDAVINPNCDGASNGYVVRILRDGKMTVPSTADGYSNQAKAFSWMQSQTQLND